MRLPDSIRSRAVLVGTGKYGPSSGFAAVTQISQNLEQLAELLGSRTGLEHIEVVRDPSDGSDFAQALERAVEGAEDLLLFYFVGHGVVAGNELQLTHTGSRDAQRGYTTVSYALIREDMRRSRAAIKVVILDCCYSGKAIVSGVLSGTDDSVTMREMAEIDGTYVLTATGTTSGNQLAFTDGPGGCTLFTGTLLDILRSGHRTAGEYLDIGTLFPLLESALRAAGGPLPKSSGRNTAASLALTRNPQWRRSPTEPFYLMQVRELAPSAGLVGRDAELIELEQFSWGDEEYVWWQAGPWAGKSALMTSFVLNPPENVDVVGFFITARLAGQADHAAFTDAVIEQLAALLPDERIAPQNSVGARDALRRQLLSRACDVAAAAGRRLILLVDGLDEDSGEPSIASLLPRTSHPALRVIVAGRPNPPVPLDVPDEHPLRHCRIRKLGPSRAARNVERAAKLELRGLLSGDRDEQFIVGLVASALGGLTINDIEEMTHLAPYRIEGVLTGVSGRTFQTRSQTTEGHTSYLFAHETLQKVAESTLGDRELSRYRGEIHSWATDYERQGWLDTTPEYLTRGYTRMLRSTANLAKLYDLALDPARHALLLRRTGGDVAALREIRWTGELELATGDPNLLRLATLAHGRGILTFRSSQIPAELVGVWARLGEWRRAEAMALSRQADLRDEAIALVVRELLAAGRFERAYDLADEVQPKSGQYLTAVQMAIGLAAAGRIESAVEFADRVQGWKGQDANLALVEALAQDGQYSRAEEYAARIYDDDVRRTAFRAIVHQVAAGGGHSAMVDLIRTQVRKLVRLSDFLFVVIDELVDAGDMEALLETMDASRRTVGEVLIRAMVACAMIRREIDYGFRILDGAWILARKTGTEYQAHIRPVLGLACALAGQIDRARILTDTKEIDSGFSFYGPTLVQTAIDADLFDDAVRWTKQLLNDQRDDAVSAVTRGLLRHGETPSDILKRFQSDRFETTDEASVLHAVIEDAVDFDVLEHVGEQLFPTLPSILRTIAQEALVKALMAKGEVDRAYEILTTDSSVANRAKLLALIATAHLDAGDVEVARRTAVDAESRTQPVRSWIDPRALTAIAVAVAEGGSTKRGTQLLGGMKLPAENRADGFLSIAAIQVRSNEPTDALLSIDRALDACEKCWSVQQAKTLLVAARLLGAMESFDRADELVERARQVVDELDWAVDYNIDGFLVNAIAAYCALGKFDRANNLATTFEGPELEMAVISAASKLMEEGNDRAALSWRDSLNFDEPIKALVTLTVAGELANQGNISQALALVRSVDVGLHTGPMTLVKSRGFPDLAAAILASDGRSQVSALIGSPAESMSSNLILWAKIANAAARQGNIGLARRLIRGVESRRRELEVYDEDLSSNVLQSIAETYAQVGDSTEAFRIALAMADDAEAKPITLTAIACTGADAQFFVGNALALTERWTVVLERWAATDPEQVADITETLVDAADS